MKENGRTLRSGDMSRNDLIELTIMKKVHDCDADPNCTGEGRYGIRYLHTVDDCEETREIMKRPPVVFCRFHLKQYLECEENLWTEYHRIVVED